LYERGRHRRYRLTVATAIAVVLGLSANASLRAQQSSPPAQQGTPPAPQSTPQIAPSTPQATPPAQPSTPSVAPAPSTPAPSAGTPMPEIVVSAPKPKRAVARSRLRAGARTAATTAPAGATVAAQASGTGGNANSTAPLEQAPAMDKTGTKLADLPQSVVVVPRAVVTEQGGTSLSDAVHNVSGINLGGSSSYGFFDRFTIRGMDARIYSDQFPDGDQFNGFPHSMNGVQSIEVLKGPGSALFGSSTPGGTIDLIHFMPSAVPGYGISQQIGSFGSWTTSVYATGPTSVPGLTYRVDGLFQHSDGFRDLKNADYEIRPVLSWNRDNHVTTVALDLRHIERTPDSYGILYFNGASLAGTPLTNVANTAKYSTPFSYGNQDFERSTLTDAWWIADYLTVNNRFSFMHRDVDILRNAGGGTIAQVAGLFQQQGRQLREQTDNDQDFTYQFEPVWKFRTGSVGHTLLTGAQVEWQSIDDNRATADLPNIANVYAPVIPETSTAGLIFLRDAKHSGMVDDLKALYLSTYATDQIDVTDQWKVRLGIRQDHWYEQLTPLAVVPGRIAPNGTPLEPGMTDTEIDTPTSWSVGTLYKILPGVAPFAGVSKSYLTNFNSEATQSGVVAPESGLEYEAGIKFSTPDGRFVFTPAAFEIFRNNVFTENTTTNTIAFNAQTSRGVDADLQVTVTPEWKIQANAIAQKAVLTAVPLTPTQVGNWPVGVPAYILNLWTTYDFAIAGVHGFRVGGGLSYNSKTYANTGNTAWIPDSTVANAMFGYYDKHWDAQVGIKNITNVEYFSISESAGGYVGEPRTYYAKASWHY
jgi:iron complex outermembrane receptor protein